jgi:hypothetical protein
MYGHAITGDTAVKKQPKSGSRPKKKPKVAPPKPRNRTEVTTHPDGSRTYDLDDEMMDLLAQQKRAFVAKFGREPTGDDPLFFDPDADTPSQISDKRSDDMWSELVAAMESQGLRPELIHATRRTNRVVTEANAHLLSPADLDEWNAAVDEYFRWKKRADDAEAEHEHPAVVYAMRRTGIRIPDPKTFEVSPDGKMAKAAGLTAEWFEAFNKFMAEHPEVERYVPPNMDPVN